MLKTALIYGLALAVGAIGLQWLESQLWAPPHLRQVYVGAVAALFLGLGVWVGARLFQTKAQTGDFQPNDQALASLGITQREYEVLRQLAAGHSNKQIAGRLHVSPNTIKTHIGRLYEKLNAARRTDAILRARELHLIP